MSSKDSKIAAAQEAYGKDFAELEDIAKQRQAEKAKTAAREGGDYFHGNWSLSASVFQSTPPARGGDHLLIRLIQIVIISIHAPPRGGRHLQVDGANIYNLFQSTPPARGATPGRAQHKQSRAISIHAPREGGDEKTWRKLLRE